MSLEEGDDEMMMEVLEIEKLELKIRETEIRNERKRKLIETMEKLEEEGNVLDKTVN